MKWTYLNVHININHNIQLMWMIRLVERGKIHLVSLRATLIFFVKTINTYYIFFNSRSSLLILMRPWTFLVEIYKSNYNAYEIR